MNIEINLLYRVGYIKGKNRRSLLPSFSQWWSLRYLVFVQFWCWLTFLMYWFNCFWFFAPLQGGVSSGYKNYIADKGLNDETYTPDSVALIRISGTSVHNDIVVQVDAVCLIQFHFSCSDVIFHRIFKIHRYTDYFLIIVPLVPLSSRTFFWVHFIWLIINLLVV